MQRRTATKGQAHISPPKGSPTRMGSRDSEKQSRLNRRSFGVTNRIWIILFLILSILFVSRYILGPASSSSAGGHRLLSSDLKPKNYLNATELQHPESPFPFCPVYGEGDEVGKKYGGLALTKTRLHLGSGARIQRVVNKAMSGLPVTISVVGGSGVCHRPLFSPFPPPPLWAFVTKIRSCWTRQFFMLTDIARIPVYSIRLPRRWNGPSVAKLLPIQIFQLVEHGVSTSGVRAHKWRDEAYQLRLLLFLQFAPYTRRDGLDNYRTGHRRQRVSLIPTLDGLYRIIANIPADILRRWTASRFSFDQSSCARITQQC